MNLMRSFVVVAALALSCGCESNGGSSGATASLGGTSWRLAGWSVSSLNPADFDITAKFADGTISGRAAVNSYGGPYSASADGAFATGALMMTEMAGPEPAMRAERIYLDLLAQARRFRIAGDVLTLLDGNRNELLIFDRAG